MWYYRIAGNGFWILHTCTWGADKASAHQINSISGELFGLDYNTQFAYLNNIVSAKKCLLVF
jgi:hypothetical protein